MADDHRLEGWAVESIPQDHLLFMRVHRNNVAGGELMPVALRDHAPPEGGRPALSTDWSKYSTPEQTLARAKHPEANGVVRMVVGMVRAIPGLVVEHAPLPDNRAHTDVIGDKKDPEIRILLTRACEWVIRVA